ncbi:DUF445 family protein [Flammeovirga pacifica]|uniref:DUF445 family protein n=1 Tax=Flammeovirga pacifica TaxID=915059 RepID=A0A1S1YWK9_FLAPC|nr:DUF445 family protein [Flammeovirga pacifica]OHX65273.1 hypothetical protein NH26_02385 [Flammeovirga pacifica]
MISELFLKIISGAVVGYTTNDLALRMLFEKVLGIPSIVEQTKDTFIKNISQLVESEIIRHDNISEEVKKEKFREAFLIMLTEFIENQLRTEFAKDEKLSDIPGIDESIERLILIIEDKLDDIIRKTLNGTLSELRIADFTSQQQVSVISESIYDLSVETLKDEHFLEILSNDIWHEFKREKVSDVFSPIIFDSVSSYTTHFFDELHETLKDGELPIDAFIHRFLENIEASKLIFQLSESISKKKISEILGSGDHQKIANEVHQVLSKELSNTSENAPFRRLIYIFIDVLKQEETSIFQILPPAIGDNFEKFIRKNIPILLDAVIEWIQENRIEINALVNQSFEENSSTIGKWLVNILYSSVSEQFGVVDKIIEIANNQKTDEKTQELAQEATDFIINYLKEHSLGSLLQKFNQDKLTEVLHQLVISLVDEKLLGKGADSMSVVLERKVGQLWPAERQKNDLLQLTHYLIDEKLVRDFLYQRKSTDKGKEIVVERINRIKNQPLYSIFNDQTIEKFGKKVQLYSYKTLHDEKKTLLPNLEKSIWKEIKNKHFANYFGPSSIQKITPKLKKLASKLIRKISDDTKQRPIHDLIGVVEKISSLPLKLTNAIIGYIDRNINRLMQGQVSRIVEQNLHNKHQQLPEMVKGFMGNNMKPITYFGAILGAIAGGITSFIHFGDSTTALLITIACVYGVTGLGTNWIAIKMIFRPYRPKYLFGLKLPFTPSVISSNQSNFAQNMGDFVGQQLLNEESIGSDIEDKLGSLKSTIFNTFVESDYKTIDTLLDTEKKNISKKVSKVIANDLFTHRYDYASKSIKALESELDQLTDIDAQTLENTFANLSQKEIVYTTLSAYFTKRVILLLQDDLMLEDALPEKFVEQIFEGVREILKRQITKTNNWIQDDTLFDELKMIFRDKLIQYRSKTLNEVPLFHDNKNKIKEKVWGFIDESMNDSNFQDKIFKVIERQILKYSEKDLPIRDLFGGRPYQLLQEQSIGMIEQLMHMIIKRMNQSDEEFAQRIYETAKSKNRLSVLYEGIIKKTTKDLVNNKVPDLLLRGLPEITQKIQHKISIIAKETKVKELEISIQNDVLRDTVKSLLTNQRLTKSIQFVLNRIVDEVFNTKIEDILNVGDVTEGELYDSLSRNLAPEIEIIRSHIDIQLNDKQKSALIVNDLLVMIIDIFNKIILSKKVKDIFEGVDDKELEKGIQNTFSILLGSRSFQKLIKHLASSLSKEIGNKGLHHLFDKQQMLHDLERGIYRSIENHKVQEQIRDISGGLSHIILDNFNHSLKRETKDYLLDKMLEGLMKSAIPHSSKLIRKIDFKGIVVNEINMMDPQKIEELFYGFAGVYFNRLIIYGFFLGLPIGAMLDFGLIQLVNFLLSD